MSTPSDDEIIDRSKSDVFTKLFAVVQSGWLIVSSIARVRHGYAITELELATMAFIVCALLMYIFWWNKPFGIEQRSVIVRLVHPGDEERFLSPVSDDQRESDLDLDGFRALALENDGLATDENLFESENWPTLSLYLSGMAFSAVHVAAWNWEFPSRGIKIMWRISTAAAFGASFLPFVLMSLGLLWKGVQEAGDRPYGPPSWGKKKILAVIRFLFGGTGWGVLALYVVARLVILVLTFYCFTAMPASAYEKVAWTGYIPHFS